MTTGVIAKSALADDPTGGETFKYQSQLPKLPIPPLNDTLDRYLSVLKPLQSTKEHETTKKAVKDFLETDGPELQGLLQTYATDKSSYIEEFWYDSYLQHTDPVVLNLNPFFLLEDDPTPLRNDQVVRASSLIYSTLTFVEALRNKTLEPDVFRGVPLCMSQFTRLFATARVPTDNGCYIAPADEARHIVVMAHSQCYHFEVLDEYNQVLLSEKEIASNLKAILRDAATIPVKDIANNAIGVLTTENRRNWARLRGELKSDPVNREALNVVDTALFIVCLDHVEPATTEELSTNMLCGSYKLDHGLQIGTCTNRWYDKLQIIVCKNGSAGINFEHTGVDGHTVLRYVSDIYTDTILRFAKTINSQTKSIFHSYKQSDSQGARRDSAASSNSASLDINPRRIEWNMTEELTLGVRFAETRLSDLILQNEVKVLEFTKYGKYFITDMKMSPDAFVQMAYQAAYYGLYGKCECTYEPAMTKTFLHGRTESVRSVTEESLKFVQTYYSRSANSHDKLEALRAALRTHTKLTRECAKGLGQDRHLYALECLWDRIHKDKKKPTIFTDAGWLLMNHTVISTSNCGNPALRLFGFGPVVSDGFGIGYIIKEDGIAFVASSKHRQTQRFLDTLQKYLIDIQVMLQNEKYPGGLSQRQRLLAMEEAHELINGYSYFDNGDQDKYLSDTSSQSRDDASTRSITRKVGKRLVLRQADE
ncbi:acyltransferase ChoActase/COT/CPT [Radiomyces spectabilis]|uniref:acyltransferase ChoActase/COT/CPT n=1 Tax=Radiomyces spectabilis TaxID=64574 RepID=UPI002221082E|nr:acyltransferase ChoActase/COT/CPT [Radiomyces spectabilis]KAI8391249.1 acyltransferase ChoActase/COT/CPT [Radiomyces spectabilis]